MGWQDLLSTPDDTIMVPWTGGRELRAKGRVFHITGRVPPEHGWHSFRVTGGKSASWKEPVSDPDVDTAFAGTKLLKGYLVGDRLVMDGAPLVLDPLRIVEQTHPVALVEPGLDRFARVRVGRWEDGRLIYIGQEFPLGPEGEVVDRYLDQATSVSDIKGVTPALDLAFRFETWLRTEQIRLREEAERLAREEAARLEREAQRAAVEKQLGTGAGRRAMAVLDFESGARAALRLAGAEFLDCRDSFNRGEAIVHFRYRNRKWECVVQKATLRIVDSGICLVNHATGERGDTKYTLESLPAVIGEAIDTHKLVVFRHADGNNRDEDWGRGDEDDDLDPWED